MSEYQVHLGHNGATMIKDMSLHLDPVKQLREKHDPGHNPVQLRHSRAMTPAVMSMTHQGEETPHPSPMTEKSAYQLSILRIKTADMPGMCLLTQAINRSTSQRAAQLLVPH